ncbi:hypothetical protein F9802_18200 [Bacillus aerolatus]|uniref:PH domain-containing protein n=1 Tax=Bacillus aerolatus TaxID=2653354 RepID=A0A6I1FB67_9BACI|nr:hypothetical protein [Bacillus aerolatus]KAB7704224.1 hypothetical protein F9802_18200 [Bacillus aerolatus]
MGLLLFSAGVLVLLIHVYRKNRSSNYKIDNGTLIVNNNFNQVKIPLTEIVEVIKIGKTTKQPYWFNVEKFSSKEDNVAVFTRSNVSYLLKMRSAKALIRELKEQNPQVHIKAKVI